MDYRQIGNIFKIYLTMRKLKANLMAFLLRIQMTLADIHFYSTIENLHPNMPDVLARHPRLQQLYDRVGSNPRIAEYLKRRPLTSF